MKHQHPLAVELVDVTRHHHGTPPVVAVDNVNLRVSHGEFVSIIGPSGSGKSSLLNILGTLDQPTSGSVTIDGQTISNLGQRHLANIRAAHIGFVFQQFHLLGDHTAQENVEVGLAYTGHNPAQRRRMAEHTLAAVGLQHRRSHRPHELSGGERQRVAIARAIAKAPTVVLADEPTGNLDSNASQHVMDLLHGLNNNGTTLILITHDQNIAQATPRTIAIEDGRIQHDRTNAKERP